MRPQVLVFSILLFLIGSIALAAEPNFYLDTNGVTIKCLDCNPGDKGTVNGIEYEAVNNSLLLERRTEGADLSRVCVSLVTEMTGFFFGDSTFNQDISSWDVSHVTTMKEMFLGAQLFNINLSCWDVSRVTDMNGMFYGARSFNQDLSSWNVGSVTDMGWMFFSANSFNQNLSDWNVSSILDMSWMFYRATSFNQDLSRWDVSSVSDMSYMFGYASLFNGDLKGWDLSNVTNLSNMFCSATSFDGDLSGWNVSRVTDMRSLFYGASSFNQDISDWNVSRAIDMGWMFSGADAFNQDISRWDVSSVTKMGQMFNSADVFNQDISDWNVGNVSIMSGMFYGAVAFNQDLSRWNVSGVSDMSFMFSDATSFNCDLSRWNVSNVTDLSNILFRATSFSTGNYNALLRSWSKLPLHTHVIMHAWETKYTSEAAEERKVIIDNYGWEIYDAGIATSPSVATNSVSIVAYTNATLGGDVTSEGEFLVAESGIVYNTIGAPTISDSLVQMGSGVGVFAEQISKLVAGTTYFVRAYANSAAGTVYGDEVSFTTLNKAPQSFIFSTLASKTYGDASFVLGDLKTNKDLPVIYTADDTTVVRISGEEATILKAGETKITAQQAGNDTIVEAVLEHYLTVLPKSITVTADASQRKIYGDSNPILLYSVSPELIYDDGFSGELIRANGEVVGKYSISKGTLSASDNYDITFKSADFEIVPKSITLTRTVVDTVKYFNSSTDAVVKVGGVIGIVGSDEVSVMAVANYEDDAIGENKTITVVYNLQGADAPNYYAPVDSIITNGKILRSVGVHTSTIITGFYPNPVNETIHLILEGIGTDNLTYSIADIVGHTITYKQLLYISAGKAQIDLRVLNLKQGIYFLQLFSLDGAVSEIVKFTKE